MNNHSELHALIQLLDDDDQEVFKRDVVMLVQEFADDLVFVGHNAFDGRDDIFACQVGRGNTGERIF